MFTRTRVKFSRVLIAKEGIQINTRNVFKYAQERATVPRNYADVFCFKQKKKWASQNVSCFLILMCKKAQQLKKQP